MESKVENEMLSVKVRLAKTIRWNQVKPGADAEKQVSDDAKKAIAETTQLFENVVEQLSKSEIIGSTYETLKMRKKVHQIEEKCEVLDKLQKLSKENGKDDTKLRNFAAKLNRLDAAVQPQQNTRSLETAQFELRIAKDAEAAKKGKPEVRSLKTREGLYDSGADKRLRCRAA